MKPDQNIETLTSYTYIINAIDTIKSSNEGYITNFFLREDRCNLLIKNKLLYVVRYEKCIFVLYEDRNFFHLYYICSNEKTLADSLRELVNNYTDYILVTDIIGTEMHIQKIAEIFSQIGFSMYTTLCRMSRFKNLDEPQIADAKVKKATYNQAEQIFGIFEKYFDKYSEQLPLLEEIARFIDNDNVLVITEQQKVLAFVIFEINGMTSYLRYWFVLPEYRDRKLGSVLLRRFFYESCNTKRQIFWVITSNENAVSRYKHYGFEAETMLDQVMIKSNNACKVL
jgi:ribosomal protein S18 acetylase RimI-like enzyme